MLPHWHNIVGKGAYRFASGNTPVQKSEWQFSFRTNMISYRRCRIVSYQRHDVLLQL